MDEKQIDANNLSTALEFYEKCKTILEGEHLEELTFYIREMSRGIDSGYGYKNHFNICEWSKKDNKCGADTCQCVVLWMRYRRILEIKNIYSAKLRT